MFACEPSTDHNAKLFLFEGGEIVCHGDEGGVVEFEELFVIDEIVIPGENFAKTLLNLGIVKLFLYGGRLPHDQDHFFPISFCQIALF